MIESFFKSKTQNEHELYGQIRDNKRAIDTKETINNLWLKYKKYAHKRI